MIDIPQSETSPLTHVANSRLALRRQPRATVLAYHELSPGITRYRYALSVGQFEETLQLVQRLNGSGSTTVQPLVISFDDGHISNYVHALPLLEKYSSKAIFFVVAGRIGERRDFMTWSHLQDLISLGHRVESHSWSHKFLTDCSDHELCEELVRSRETLEERLASPVVALSAPHGRWNVRVAKACADAGYHCLYTSDPWVSGRVADRLTVAGRLMMSQSTNPSRLLNWLTMGPAQAGLHRTQYSLKHAVRQVLGNKLYYWLWARLVGWQGDDTHLDGRL